MGGGRDKRDSGRDYKDRRSQFSVDHRQRKSSETPKSNKDGQHPKASAESRDKSSSKDKDVRQSKFEPVREKDQKITKNIKRESSNSEKDGKDEKEMEPKKFTGRCRLFVGNVPPETSERDFSNWFTPFGECSEVFLNAGRGFGFIRMVSSINIF